MKASCIATLTILLTACGSSAKTVTLTEDNCPGGQMARCYFVDPLNDGY